jgi:hypothetical protein
MDDGVATIEHSSILGNGECGLRCAGDAYLQASFNSVGNGDNWGISLEERCKVTLHSNVVYGNNAAALYVDGASIQCEARCNAFLRGPERCAIMDLSGKVSGVFVDNVVQGWEECVLAHCSSSSQDGGDQGDHAHSPVDLDMNIQGTRACSDEDAAVVVQGSLDMISKLQEPITRRVIVINPCSSMCVGVPSGRSWRDFGQSFEMFVEDARVHAQVADEEPPASASPSRTVASIPSATTGAPDSASAAAPHTDSSGATSANRTA